MDFKKVPIPIERGSGGYSTRESAEKALKGVVMPEIDANVYMEGILDCYNLTFSDFIQFCADNRLFEACALQKELKWWQDEESRCPKCGSSDICEETYSWFDGDEVIVTKCQSCGFFAAGTTREESLKTFEQGGVERGK